MKIYSAVKLPQVATKLLDDAGIQYEMHNELSTPSEDEIIEKVAHAEVLISGVNVPVTEKIIRSNPELKMIANVGAGTNNIDVETARELNIPVTNTPGDYSIISTSELALALMLAVSRNILSNQEMVQNRDFPGWQVMGYLGGDQVSFKKMFIMGFGRIGQEIAKYGKVMHMDVMYYDIQEIDPEVQKELNARPVSIEEGLKEADYVVLQMKYTPENHHLISKNELELMKESAYLINTARGGVVDEEAVADALEAGKIKGAAFDVHEQEPVMNERLIELDNVVLTPHVGNDTYEARNEMAETAVDQAIKFIQEQPLDYVINGVNL